MSHRNTAGKTRLRTIRWDVRPAIVAILLLFMTTVGATALRAESDGNPLEGITFEGLGYIDYSAGKTPAAGDKESDYNRFQVTRGYITLKKKVNPWMSFRATLDIHQDETGDYKRRDKYFYAELKPGDAGLFTNMKSEIGLGHIPWLDFEEHINPYRCQGTMAIERAGVLNSADMGISLSGYFGGDSKDVKQMTGNSHYSGRYGSWHVGVYNGGGYHASEANENKVVEGRVTVRPLPEVAPGLQLSYFGLYGKGNVAASGALPDYIVNMGMISYEHPRFIFTGQVFATEGNAKGSWVDPSNEALKTLGFSAFGNVNIPGTHDRFHAFARVDRFDADRDDVIADKTAYTMVLGGMAFTLYKKNMILVVFETTDYEKDFGKAKGGTPVPGNMLGKDQKAQVVYQIAI